MVHSRRTLAYQYKPYLCAAMAFKDGTDGGYPRTIEFGAAQLGTLTADHISRHFNNMAFGTPTPGPNDHPTHIRSTTLEQAKKAISYFMPNKHIPWNVDTNTGNPTKSPQVAGVIRLVKRLEVRRQGRAPLARRELTMAEWRLTMRLLEDGGIVGRNFNLQTKLPCMMKLQVHVIARADDTTHIRSDALKQHHRFPFCLQIRLNWSKNVMDERSCPLQIMIGADDVDYCSLLGKLLTLLFVSACCGQYTNPELYVYGMDNYLGMLWPVHQPRTNFVLCSSCLLL